MAINCRFYREHYPSENDVIVVKVKKIADSGVFVSLLEYNDIEGHIGLGDLSKRRLQSSKHALKEGQLEVCEVTLVDRVKGFIDLSKKQLSEKKIKEVANRWNSSKAFHSIIRHVAMKSNGLISALELYELFGWEIYDICAESFENRASHPSRKVRRWLVEENQTPLRVLQMALSRWTEFCVDFNIPEDIQDNLYHKIHHRLKPQVVSYRAFARVCCFKPSGIDSIKKALNAGLQEATNEFPVIIRLEANAHFSIQTDSTGKPENALSFLWIVLRRIEAAIEKEGGTFMIRLEPHRVQNEKDRARNHQMTRGDPMATPENKAASGG